MKDLPTVRGARIGIQELPPERYYRYGGNEPFAADKAATGDMRRLCADPECARDDIKAKGLCKLHYERARTRKARIKKEAAA